MKNPKHILITGASSGIGAALALYYAVDGVFLYINGRNEDRLIEIANKCHEQGAVVETSLANVTDQVVMAEWVKGKTLDLVIANAGISGGTGGRVDGEPVTEARSIFDVNVNGVFNTIEPSLKAMKNQKNGGQIAVVSSLAGFRGWPSSPAYSASKGAVRFYGEALRGALKNTKIQVNVICPGFVTSRITDQNDFPMPFKMEAGRAAKIIARGLEKNKGRICFPWPMYLMTWFIGILPDVIAQKLLSHAPSKNPSKI
jgi:short-subunit dehydrogenase